MSNTSIRYAIVCAQCGQENATRSEYCQACRHDVFRNKRTTEPRPRRKSPYKTLRVRWKIGTNGLVADLEPEMRQRFPSPVTQVSIIWETNDGPFKLSATHRAALAGLLIGRSMSEVQKLKVTWRLSPRSSLPENVDWEEVQVSHALAQEKELMTIRDDLKNVGAKRLAPTKSQKGV